MFKALSEAADEQARRRAAALAAGGALASTVGYQQTEEKIPTPEARKSAIARILAALVAFLTAKRKRDEEFLRAELSKRGTGDIQAIIDEEMKREDEFARNAAERFTRDLTTATAIPDRTQREAAIRGLLGREAVYARQRSEAMFARGVAAVERTVLRTQSPSGAFWKLDPLVAEHTAGCLIMGGKFWPWAVLNRVHPPRHPGCPCRLVSYGQAIAEGLMRPGDVRNVKDALRAAAHVMMEGEAADRLLAELDMRDALVEAGLADPDALADIPLGAVVEVDGSSD